VKIGAIDGSLGQPWETLFGFAAQLGFEGVELGVGADYAETKLWNPAGRGELKALAGEAGIAICSVCCHSYWSFSFASADVAVRAQAAAIAREAAAAAADVGAGHLLIPVTSAEGASPNEAQARWVEGMKSVAPAASAAGVVFCIENVGQPFATTADQIAGLVDAIDHPAVMAYFDPGNAVYAGLDPVAYARSLGARIGQVHIKDPGGDLLGEGKVDLAGVVAALHDVAFDGWLVLETPTTDDPAAAGEANRRYLERLLA